ncbi:hypothetical protein ABZ485_27985 [Streptomyces albogriseolus]|uniref:hypothetical protein n=1 Tax=Streptomyces albogriseolus TaxID=1887 RepID=UPI00346052F0
MPELRLVDPDGYTVPGTAQTVPDADVPAVRHRLLTETAPQHAAQWADFGYHADAYRIHPEPSASPQETS